MIGNRIPAAPCALLITIVPIPAPSVKPKKSTLNSP
jgi:hypothetical protein